MNLRVEDVDEVTPEHETSVAVELTSDTVARRSPATVRIRLRNESDAEREYLAGDGSRRVFSQVESTRQRPGLVLVTREQATKSGLSLDDLPDTYRLPRLPSGGYLVMKGVTLEPDESFTIDLDIYGHPENSVLHLPSGSFRFEERYGYRPFGGDGSKGEFRWGFTIDVRENPAPW